ncbi:MAG TPA: hypothetical protein V6C58_24630 [Allocoleopsis sp.]
MAKIKNDDDLNNNEHFNQIYGPDPVKEQLEWKDDELFIWTFKDDLNQINKIIKSRDEENERNKLWLEKEILPLRKWLIDKGFIK